jgi:hypothetical protein
MNVLFLSPFFPPNAHRFCRALRARGVNVLAIGDEPPERQPSGLVGVLHEYVFEPHMADYGALKAAAAGLVARHGVLHRLDSNGEHWLEAEGRLRDDFGVPGISLAETQALRSKLQMGHMFAKAAVAYPRTISGASLPVCGDIVAELGLPLVVKPDSGSGAVDTFVVATEAELRAALSRDLSGHVMQPFIAGDIVTFDGLTDASGRIVFCTSHAYDTGIMQVREGGLDGHYYSLREIPAELESVGRRTVEAFHIRGRFFHVEFFVRLDGSYMGLEMNIRPPGGYTTDMMNAACDIDVYDLWAAALTGVGLVDFSYERRYFTAHAGRRTAGRYRLDQNELARELGATLFEVCQVPDAFAATMGNTAYLLRHEDLPELKRAIGLVQERAST